MSAGRCTHRHGRFYCGGRLSIVTDGMGGTRTVCEFCERRLRGICRECPLPVKGQIGRALRCERHQKQAVRASLKRYAERNRELVNQKAREYAQRPDIRAQRIAYKKAWRQVKRDKVKAQKRREGLRQLPSRRIYNARARGKYAYNRASPFGHPCLGCGITLKGRAKKCDPCRDRAFQTALQALGAA